MKNECGKIHYPNFSKTCCLRHLLSMAQFAQNQTLTKKYSNLLLTTLNHAYKENAFNFGDMQLDLLILLLDVLSQFMGHFYMVQKYNYTKFLGLLAIKALKETDYKQHPEIMIRECAINNNIACLYETKENYKQAYKYICNNKKYIDNNNDFDNAIFYNNLIRICIKNKKVNEVKTYLDCYKKSLNNAISLLKNMGIKHAFENENYIKSEIDINDYNSKNELITLLMFNLGVILERRDEKQEARNVYLQGYEFSISVLGEWNFYTQRLKRKIISVSTKDLNDEKVPFNLIQKNSLGQSSSEEEIFAFKNKKSLTKSQNSKHNRSNTLDNKVNSKSNCKQFLEDKTLIDKINRICEFVERYGNQISIDESDNNNIKKQLHSELVQGLSVKTKEKNKELTYEKFKQMCKPFLKKFLKNGELGINIAKEGKKQQRSALVAEVLEEFEKEKKEKKSKPPSVSCPKPTLQTPAINPELLASPPQPPKKVPKIKALFSKVLGINKENEIKSKSLFEQITYELLNAGRKKSDGQIKMKTTQQNINENNVIFDNSTINNSVSSPLNSPKVVIQIPNPIGQNQSENFASERNLLKPELEQLTKDISFNIEYENHDEAYEFKPFYRKNNSYKKTIATIATQKKVNFIKSQSQVPASFLGSIIVGSKLEVPKSPAKRLPKPQQNYINIEDQSESKPPPDNNSDNDLISISPISSKTYEFTAYVNSAPGNESTRKKNVNLQQQKTKIIKTLNTSYIDYGDELQITTTGIQSTPLNVSRTEYYNDEAGIQINPIENDLDNNLFTGTCNSYSLKFEEILAPISNSCIDLEDELEFDDNFNFYHNRSKNALNIYSYFDQLLLPTTSNNNNSFNQDSKITNYLLILPFQNESYIVIIKNDTFQKRLIFNLYKNNSQQSTDTPLNSLIVEYVKLNKIVQKLQLFNSLPTYYDVNSIQNVDDLIKRVIAYHTIIIDKDKQLSIGLSAKPSGINGDKQITFRFLKTHCSVDILVLSKYTLRLIVTYLKSNQITFTFDIFCDKSSLDKVAQEIPIAIPAFKNTKEYIILHRYKFNEEQINKNGFIPLIMKKIQEIIKMKYLKGEMDGFDEIKNKNNKQPDDVTLIKIYKNLSDIMFRCEIENSAKTIRILFLTFELVTHTFNIENYDINENNLKPITTLLNKPIYPLFECTNKIESKLMCEKISDREQLLIKYIILSNYSYKDNKKIKEIPQENIFKFTFVPKGNDTSLVLNFNLNKYIEDIYYIGKLIVYDTVSHKTYSILFFPKCHSVESIEKDRAKLQRCDKTVMKNVLLNLYIEYIKDSPHRTVDTQDLKPLKKFLPLSYLLSQCK